MSIATPLAERVTLGKIVLLGTMFLKMPPISPTGYARLAVPGHILRVPTKIHVHRGQIAPPDSTSLQTERVPRIVFAVVVRLENILRMLTKVRAPLGPIA